MEVEPIDGVSGPAETVTEGENLEEMIQELYLVVSKKIRISVANQKLTPDNFQVILLKVVETLEEIPAIASLSGTEKRTIATNLTSLIIDDLHEHGQIDDETYGWMKLGLTFLAPVIFQGAKAAWHKIHDVVEDIQEKGCSGCCGRNFFSRKK